MYLTVTRLVFITSIGRITSHILCSLLW